MRKKIRKKKYKYKTYAHFDPKKKPHIVRKYVESPDKVAKHGFYPFIHYKIKTIKYNSLTNVRKEKIRRIFYAAHIDRYIYEHYSWKLNCIYNKKAVLLGINKCSIAYRNNLGKSNIDFAKEVLSKIKKYEECIVLIGDFSDFFDNMDHSYLKKQLLRLLDTNILPEDIYSVFKSVTKYSFVELNTLLNLFQLDRKDFNSRDVIMEIRRFRELRDRKKDTIDPFINVNVSGRGVPQGSSISSTLSNIYMMEFDQKMNGYATGRGGIYRRYSDDFVLVIPQNRQSLDIKRIWNEIQALISKTPGLELQPDKTKMYFYNNVNIERLDKYIFPKKDSRDCTIHYLGFSFDGKNVTIRQKAIQKFYARMYRKIRTVNKYTLRYQRNVFRRNLFNRYSHLGKRRTKGNHGNFLTYVDMAQKKFGDNEPIKKQVKNHWKKLNNKLIKVNIRFPG